MLRADRATGLALLVLLLIVSASAARAAGPLRLYDPATRTPLAYGPGTVDVYTDLGPCGPVLTNAEADAVTAFAFGEWSAVPTATFSAAVAGDFGSLGLPDITGANGELVVGPYNGGGIHVMYDNDATILTEIFGVPPGVAGLAGPEYASGGVIIESYVVVNGTFADTQDSTGVYFAGVMTHEGGHSINLAHSQTNGAILTFGDDTGPDACGTPYGGSPTTAQIETMYPFTSTAFGGVGQAMSTVDRPDDFAALADVYPGPGWPTSYAEIQGILTGPGGLTEVTGVNVIARSLADPFGDCVSGITGDFTQGKLGPDGLFRLRGLTPGEDYVVYIDDIVAGGFSTPDADLDAPGEEYYNGGSEDFDPLVDDRCAWVTVVPMAGVPSVADIQVNTPYLPLLDDTSIEVPLPFPFPVCGVDYTTVFVNANGSLTFGAGDEDFSQTTAEFLNGPPRLAALWADLSPQNGTSVTAGESGSDFVVAFTDIPEYDISDSNTFTFTLRADGSASIAYGQIDATRALAGRTPGSGAVDPGETNLSGVVGVIQNDTAYENFTGDGDYVDLSFLTLEFGPCLPCVSVSCPPDTSGSEEDVIALGNFCLTNCGSLPDTFQVTLTDTEGWCAVPAPFDTVLAPGETACIPVTCTIPDGACLIGSTEVRLIAAEPGTGVADTCVTTVTVDCAGPVLAVDPGSVDFGGIVFPDTACAKITVRNVGDQLLTVNSVAGCDTGDFFLDLAGLAAGVAPGDSTCFTVCTAPTQAGPDSCTITVDTDGGSTPVAVRHGAVVSVPDPPRPATALRLVPPAPNPFAGDTELAFSLPREMPVAVDVFDFQGRRVRSLLRETSMPGGDHRVRWDGRDDQGRAVAGGVYFVRLHASGTRTARVVRLP